MVLVQKLTSLMLIMLINGAVGEDCPSDLIDLELEPLQLVVQYGDPVSVNCSSSSNFTELNWTVSPVLREVNETVTWTVDSLTDWDVQPECYIKLGDVQCNRSLNLIIYKIPDNVSISTVGHIGAMIEGYRYKLQCDVQNVAPVQFLTVKWYKGNTLVDNSTFNDTINTPRNISSTLQILPSRDDDGAQYSCEAVLEFGPEGPWVPPVKSHPLNITVYDSCPVVLQPRKVVVEYGASVSVNCSTFIPHYGMGFEASQAGVEMRHDVNFITWHVEKLVDWDITPACFINLVEGERCQIHLPVTIYKIPNSVSISTTGDIEPMIEGRAYELLCNVQNVAPVRFLTVNWYKGDTLVHNANFTDTINTPVNRSQTLPISLSRGDNGTQYRCEAVLDLGPEGPQPVTSHPFTIIYNDSCPVVLQPLKVVVEYGASVSVNCSTFIPHNGMGFEASQAGMDMRNDVNSITWHVEKLVDWGVRSSCFINKADEEQCKINLQITIYKIPDSVSISTVGHIGPMTEGHKYMFQCDVQNVAPVQFVTVKWYKGNTLVDNSTFNDTIKTPRNIFSTLQIVASRDDDGAQYRCEAVLELGPEGPRVPPVTSHPLNITVHYKPVIHCSEWSPLINTTLGSYPYAVGGNPSPQVSWFRGRLLETSKHLSKDDSGQYEYNATNMLGSASCVTNITVEYAPEFDCPPVYEGREHRTFLNICTVMASPSANIFWYKDGIMVQPPLSLTRRDNGSYNITARNKHGTAHHQLSIHVLYGPEMQPGQEMVEVYEGRDASLACKAEGNPQPTVMWTFQNQTKATGGRQTTLTISGATFADGGVYTCTATNKIGKETRSVFLTIRDYRFVIVTVVIVVLVLIILACLFVYFKCKRRGSYNVQLYDESLRMTLLNKSG